MLASRPDFGVWRRTSPFAIVFFLGATVRTIAKSYIQLVASFGAIAYLTRFDISSGGSSVGLAILVVVLAIGAVALLRYWFFRFRFEEDRVLIRQGFLKRIALDLPFERVQGINVERSLVDRMLGLVTVRLDTAGTIVAEGRLPAVSNELADWLGTRVDGGHLPDAAPTPSTGRPLLRLTFGDMLRIGLADRKALVVAAALGALAQAAEPFQDVIVSVFDSLLTVAADLGTVGQAVAVGLLSFTVLSVLLVAGVASAFLRYYNFTLWRQGTALRSRGGLFTQKEVVVKTAKIQQITLSRNLVLHWFGRYRFGALPAGAMPAPDREGTPNMESAENLRAPLLDDSLAETLRRRIFGREARGLTLLPGDPAFTHVSPYYIRALVLRICVLSFLGGAILFLIRGGPAAIASVPFGLWCLSWTVSSTLAALQSWRRRGYLHDDEGLASRRGLVGSRVDACLFRKVQSVTLRQSPLQRRKGLATLELHLSSGAVMVPYIAHETAARLRDYILYKVESNRLRWH